MAAREKMKRAERVPWELLSRWNAARAEYLETAKAANERIVAFRAEMQKTVDSALAVVHKISEEITTAVKLDAAAGDKIDPVKGTVKRGAPKK